MAAVTICSDFEPKKIKSVTVSTPICHEVLRLNAMIFVFECWVLSQLFNSPLSPSSRVSLVPLHFLPLKWYHLHIWGCWYFSCSLNSSLWFIQPSISHDVLCKYTICKWQYTALTCSFPKFEPVCFSTSRSNYCFLSCLQESQEAGNVRWEHQITLHIFHSLLWSTKSKALA